MALRAPALPPGGTIGLVAPSSPAKAAGFRRAVATLRGLGYRVKAFVSPRWRDGYLAGRDDLRLRQLNRALRDPAVDAVVCLRGGYGALRLVDGVDFAALRRRPKILVGFSDITVLELAIWRHCRLVTFYGPMPAFPGPGYNWRWFRRMLSSPRALGPVPMPPEHVPRCLRPGRATGRILGGTLSLVSKLVGTPHLPKLDGALLFLEDVGEPPYKIDGYLAHLRLAGVFDRVAGVMLASFKKCRPRSRSSLSLDRVFRDYFGKAPYPVAVGFPFGHQDPMFTLPQGVCATLDAGRGTLELHDAPVVQPRP
ncbi:MAG: LD-carboxypeptidase [Candidatus Coatesbacteria bacterium]